MSFEVEKWEGGRWKSLGCQTAEDSAKAAGIMGYVYGPGKYRVRPEDSRDSWFEYNVVQPKN
jgi:hypothetical protein